LLPDDAVISDHARLRTYECDGLAHYRVTPALVVIPEDTAQLAAVVKVCAEHQIPYVARGSGTGLSGGALPHKDGVLHRDVADARHPRKSGGDDQRAVVEARCDQPRRQPAPPPPRAYYYAPDPSEPTDLLHRRQRRGELRGRALPEVRLHHQPRPRRGVRHAAG
jgi:glycolate oxidase